MVWRYLTLAMLVVLSTAGCNDSASKPVVSQPVIVMADDEPAVETVAVAAVDVAPASDQPVAAIRTKKTDSEADSFVPAFPDNVNFFSPPEPDAVETQPVPEVVVTASEDGESPAAVESIDLRVIGFVQVAGEPPKAMLHLDGKLEVAGAGDAIGNLEVVAVNEPSVVIRRDEQELSFALSDVAVAAGNRVTERERTGGTSRRRGAWSQSGGSSTSEAGQFALPVDFGALPAVPEPPQVELPQIDFPEVPLPPVSNAD